MQSVRLSGQRLSPFRFASSRCARRMVGAFLAVLPVVASALSLGSPQLDSGLGQVLELAIPIRTDASEDLDPKCVRLVNPADDQLPTLTVARIRVERDGLLLLARIQSLVPINEPAIRLVLEVGCARRVQREYVLLIDPPALGRVSASSERQAIPAPIDKERVPAALAFGEPRIQAVQGQRLLFTVSVLGADAARLTPACLRLVDDGGQPPIFNDARLRLASAGSARPVIEISSASALKDRMLRIVIEAGCDSALRREFNVLVDAAPIPNGETPNGTPVANPPSARSDAGLRQGADLRAPRPNGSTLGAPAAIASPAAPAAKGLPGAAVSDRLVLAAPEEPKVAPDTRPSTVPDPSEELVRRLDQLSSEVKRLRGELDSANQRNSALADKLARDHGWTLGWWIVGAIALVFAAWSAFTWRRRGSETEEAVASEGPLTRIIGKQTVEVPAPQSEHAGTVLGSVLVGSHLSEMRPDLHVTEMADEDAIRELYADVIRGNAMSTPLTRVTNLDMPLDLLVGDTAISGSFEHDRGVGKHASWQTDSRGFSEHRADAGAQARQRDDAVAVDADVDALVEPWNQEPFPRSQAPTTVLKPLELDLDLSDLAQRNGKRPPA